MEVTVIAKCQNIPTEQEIKEELRALYTAEEIDDIINRVDNAVIIHRRNNDFLRLSRQMFGWNNDHALYKDGIGNVLEICKDRENGTQDKFIPLFSAVTVKILQDFARIWQSQLQNLVRGFANLTSPFTSPVTATR